MLLLSFIMLVILELLVQVWYLSTTGKMEITTEEKPNGTGRYFDAGDIALGITYAKYLNR